jgi:hypothetical protein
LQTSAHPRRPGKRLSPATFAPPNIVLLRKRAVFHLPQVVLHPKSVVINLRKFGIDLPKIVIHQESVVIDRKTVVHHRKKAGIDRISADPGAILKKPLPVRGA